jgi:hypothetical protein
MTKESLVTGFIAVYDDDFLLRKGNCFGSPAKAASTQSIPPTSRIIRMILSRVVFSLFSHCKESQGTNGKTGPSVGQSYIQRFRVCHCLTMVETSPPTKPTRIVGLLLKSSLWQNCCMNKQKLCSRHILLINFR